MSGDTNLTNTADPNFSNKGTYMIFCFSKTIYPKIVLLKAAYAFIDEAYIHLDTDDDNWLVSVEMKAGKQHVLTEKDFLNEMLIQSLRHEVYQQTKNIREMLFARTIASSLVLQEPTTEINDETNKTDFSEKEILRDWFTE